MAWLAPALEWFYLVFALQGMANAAGTIGAVTGYMVVALWFLAVAGSGDEIGKTFTVRTDQHDWTFLLGLWPSTT